MYIGKCFIFIRLCLKKVAQWGIQTKRECSAIHWNGSCSSRAMGSVAYVCEKWKGGNMAMYRRIYLIVVGMRKGVLDRLQLQNFHPQRGS